MSDRQTEISARGVIRFNMTHRLKRDLQQVQHHSVSAHVLQQPLLLHTTLLTGITQLTEPQEDLNITHTHAHTSIRDTLQNKVS